jgi:hypothetical protein
LSFKHRAEQTQRQEEYLKAHDPEYRKKVEAQPAEIATGKNASPTTSPSP